MKIYGQLAIVSLNSSYLISPEFCALRKSQNVFAVYQESWGTHISMKHLFSTAHNFTPLCIIPRLKTWIYPSEPFSERRCFLRISLSYLQTGNFLSDSWPRSLSISWMRCQSDTSSVFCFRLNSGKVSFPFLNSCFEDKERTFISPRASQGVPACQSSPAWGNSIRQISAGLNPHQVTGPSNLEGAHGNTLCRLLSPLIPR